MKIRIEKLVEPRTVITKDNRFIIIVQHDWDRLKKKKLPCNVVISDFNISKGRIIVEKETSCGIHHKRMVLDDYFIIKKPFITRIKDSSIQDLTIVEETDTVVHSYWNKHEQVFMQVEDSKEIIIKEEKAKEILNKMYTNYPPIAKRNIHNRMQPEKYIF